MLGDLFDLRRSFSSRPTAAAMRASACRISPSTAGSSPDTRPTRGWEAVLTASASCAELSASVPADFAPPAPFQATE